PAEPQPVDSTVDYPCWTVHYGALLGWSEAQAERVASWVRVDPPVGAATRKLRGADVQHLRLRGVHIGHRDVEVPLLGVRRAGPLRADMPLDLLEHHPTAVAADEHPRLALPLNLHAEQFRVEPAQRARVLGVEGDRVQTHRRRDAVAGFGPAA